jgi:methyl-accepting chemotaxis protein
MKKLSDIAIGKKLALVLGGCVALLAGLSGISLWGFRTLLECEDQSRDRLARNLLVEKLQSGINEACVHVREIIALQKVSEQELVELRSIRKEYLAALETFKNTATSPKGKQYAKELDDLVQEFLGYNNRVLELNSAGKQAEAVRHFEEKSMPMLKRLNVKSDETQELGAKLAEESQQKARETASTVWIAIIVGSIIAVVLAAVGGIFLTRSIAKPLETAIAGLNEVAGGDLTHDTSTAFLARGDEIGLLAKAKQAMLVSLRQLVQEVAGGIQVLSSSSAELSANSGEMSSGSREASDKAHAVAAAAEQMTANVSSVAAGMEETTTNLTSVSSHTEQMTATIGEIAANSEKARRITEEATRQAERISQQMNQLGQAAQEIGKVTETITEISSQTNLLALNATIEAARAGS